MEEWKVIPGYEKYYMASDKGRIKSLERECWNGQKHFTKPGRILKQKLDDKGYYRVNLYAPDKKPKGYLVHRLVAMAFLPKPEKKDIAGHDDDNKTNNDVNNIYWTDSKENNWHNGKLERFQKERMLKINIIADKLSKAVIGINVSTSETIKFKSMQEAQRNGFHSGQISKCCNGKRKTHKGYMWEFAHMDKPNE
jgi:hypothetical protein